MYLPSLRARASHTATTNPTVEGVIATFADDVVGENGPMLQVHSDNPQYNQRFEEAWEAWWSGKSVDGNLPETPDAQRRQGGPEMMRSWTQDLWKCGEFLFQFVTKKNPRPGEISLLINAIHPRRLGTPAQMTAENDLVLGVRIDSYGAPREYVVAKPTLMGVYEIGPGSFDTIPANDMVHEFITSEAGQVRGYPWLSSSLQPTADMNQFDAEVLEAARMAANQAVYWYTDHPDAPFLNINEESDVERGTQQTGPPGWRPMMLTPTQPAPNYEMFRSERQRDVGRPAGMPLMMVRLDSSKHSYSGARFDSQVYQRGIRKFRGWLDRRALSRLVAKFAREAHLIPGLLPKRPAKVTYEWIWGEFPNSDPLKDAMEEDTRLRNKTLSYSDAIARRGGSLEVHIAKLKRDEALAKAAGIELAPEPKSGSLPTDPPADQADEPAATTTEKAST